LCFLAHTWYSNSCSLPSKMVRGVKRAEDGVAPPQKKVKADPKLASVKHTLEGSDLPDAVKSMLVAMLPNSLAVDAMQRDSHQTRVVDMIGEVYEAIESKMKLAADSARGQVVVLENSKETLETSVQTAEAQHSHASEVVESKKPVLAECFSSASECKIALASDEEAQRTGDASGLAVEHEHHCLKVAIDEHLKVLREGSWEMGSAKQHLDILIPLATKWTDESLVTALPSTCIKPPTERSSFDNMVLDQLEVSLKARLDKLCADIEAEAPAKTGRTAAVCAAQQRLQQAVDAQVKASEEVASALSLQKEALAALEEAKKHLTAFKPALKHANESADEAQAEMELFHDNCRVNCFDALKMRTSVEIAPAAEPDVSSKVDGSCPVTVSDAAVAAGGC